MIHTVMECNVVLVRHARFLNHVSVLNMLAEAYHERDRCPARDAIFYSYKKGHF